MNFIKVELNREERIIEIKVVKKPEDTDSLDFFHEHVSDIIDIVNMGVYDYEEDIAVIVDDEGLLVSNNPVYSIDFNGKTIHLAGSLLIGKNSMCEDGLETVGFTNDEIINIDKNDRLAVNIIGFTA